MGIQVEAHAKINWALNIVGRRENGYHELDMVMHEIALADVLTIEPADDVRLTVNGHPAIEPEKNLVVRAARALNERAGTHFGAHMDLVKHVPACAGLGGGSADCAAALKALNALWGMGLSRDELCAVGVRLGADVPFCLTGGLARVRGIGEIIEPVKGAPEIPLLLVTPGALSTAEVFAAWDAGYAPVDLDAPALINAVCVRDLGGVDALSKNALTAPAVAMLPAIGTAMASLRAFGARAVLMTGSGSTVVGAFPSIDDARRAAQFIPGSVFTTSVGA